MMKREKLGIIADDLTGSNDSGIQLAKKGLRSSVIFDINPFAVRNLDDDVVVIDTDSRAIPIIESYEVTRRAAMFFKEHGFTHIYKKVDSTLRGNLGVEIQATEEVFEPEFCIIAPAFPRIGRTTRDGIHYLHGTPLSETEIARDPKCPVTDSNISNLLRSQVSVEIGVVQTAMLGNDREAWEAELTKWKTAGITWLIFDAYEDIHLEWISTYVPKLTKKVVWVGSAGLAEYLPESLNVNKSVLQDQVVEKATRVVTVSGSLSAITKKQISRLLQTDGMRAVEIDPLAVFETGGKWGYQKKTYVDQIIAIYDEGNNAMIYVDSSQENRLKTAVRGKELGISATEISNRISRGLGEIAGEVIKYGGVDGLVLIGGDTAKEVCRHIGASGFQLLKEIEPGIPLGKMIGEYNLLTITKAGAFGTEQSLVHAVKQLKGVCENV